MATQNLLGWSNFKSTGSEALAALVPTVVSTTDSAIERFSPIERKCYTDDVSFLLSSLTIFCQASHRLLSLTMTLVSNVTIAVFYFMKLKQRYH